MTQVPQCLRALCPEAARLCCIAGASVVLLADYLQPEIVKGSLFFFVLFGLEPFKLKGLAWRGYEQDMEQGRKFKGWQINTGLDFACCHISCVSSQVRRSWRPDQLEWDGFSHWNWNGLENWWIANLLNAFPATDNYRIPLQSQLRVGWIKRLVGFSHRNSIREVRLNHPN